MANFSRREFLKVGKSFLAVTGLAVVLGPIIAFFTPPTWRRHPPIQS